MRQSNFISCQTFKRRKVRTVWKVIHTTNHEDLRNNKDTVRQYTTFSAVQGSHHQAVSFRSVKRQLCSRSCTRKRGPVAEIWPLHEVFINVAFGNLFYNTRVGTLIVATIYLQLIQNRYMFRSFTVLQCSHQHCVQPVASDVEVVGYL